ncbi:DUF4190 domain-containing protein [Roseibacillus ishigakijimensis]|uniref:DUF4190 domain-containing protein n=1 Tax=Roseibacillus ishigakijimensis TaxID=454146 RepID=A0A934RTG4_9BACT|nr:DUF4190 domain-containing protein [Roseibacillus ishigakijimensis]MBK1834201.1 DUF4190 domain-containing protein [Roseibacillus ishigakijimensis]
MQNDSTPPPTPSAAPPTNGLAIAAACTGIFGIPAIVMGHIALSQIKKTGEKGKGLAIGGLVAGYFFTLLLPLLIIAGLAVPTAMKAMEKARQVTVIQQVKSLQGQLYLHQVEHKSYPASLAELVTNGILSQTELDELVTAEWGESTVTVRYSPPPAGWQEEGDSPLILWTEPPVKGKIIQATLDGTTRVEAVE